MSRIFHRKMFLCLKYFLIFIICEVTSDSGTTWKDMDNKTIANIQQHCLNKPCVAQCCPSDNQVLIYKNSKYSCQTIKKIDVRKVVNYSHVIHENGIYTWMYQDDVSNGSLQEKTLAKDFQFVRSDSYVADKIMIFTNSDCRFSIKRDGSLGTVFQCPERDALKYCVAFLRNLNSFPYVDFIYAVVADPENKDLEIINITGLLMSSVFIILILLVLGWVPKSYGRMGIFLKHYLVSLLITFVLRPVQIIVIKTLEVNDLFGQITSPVVYFFILASFFWLNILSYDVSRVVRKNYYRSEKPSTRRMWSYLLYGYGLAGLFTLILICVDLSVTFEHDDINFRPPFKDCFANVKPKNYYVNMPIAVTLSMNLIMFLGTSYYIWIATKNFEDKGMRSTKQKKDRFAVIGKLFVLQGFVWICEILFDNVQNTVWYFISNFCVLFNGVGLFVNFVCKKKIIKELCKKFNINNTYVNRWTSVSQSDARSQSTRTTNL